jgi:hypothetical protein
MTGAPPPAERPWWQDAVLYHVYCRSFAGSDGAFEDILRSWFDRGMAGFRIDTANRLVKDRLLRDNPPPTATSTSGSPA